MNVPLSTNINWAELRTEIEVQEACRPFNQRILAAKDGISSLLSRVNALASDEVAVDEDADLQDLRVKRQQMEQGAARQALDEQFDRYTQEAMRQYRKAGIHDGITLSFADFRA